MVDLYHILLSYVNPFLERISRTGELSIDRAADYSSPEAFAYGATSGSPITMSRQKTNLEAI